MNYYKEITLSFDESKFTPHIVFVISVFVVLYKMIQYLMISKIVHFIERLIPIHIWKKKLDSMDDIFTRFIVEM